MSKEIGQLNSKELFTIPNLITYFRILCVPVFIVFMALAGVKNRPLFLYLGLGTFIIAAGSDLIDGYIARKFKMQSGIGIASCNFTLFMSLHRIDTIWKKSSRYY